MKPLRILHVEDSPDDAELIAMELRRGGFDLYHRRVETPEAMRQALQSESWDIVVSDFVMPRFSAVAALRVLQETGLDLPFVIVSGTIGEEVAVDALKAGAHDFVIKDRLARFVPAIVRELREAQVRREGRVTQQALVISDRMASVGVLAAGVAHEINNPLTAVIANLDFALEQTEPGRARPLGEAEIEALHQELRHAKEAAERVRLIVRDLKAFSRAEEDNRTAIELHRALDLAIRMAGNEVRHRARLVREYQAVPSVWANESRLGQVFLNLVINAAQAIPPGRADDYTITVATRTHPDGRAVIEVRDTGEGMPPEVLANLFTPFFTTKPVGVGTGLGLTICHQIVHAIGGVFEVESAVGRGSTFRMLLPAMAAQPPAPAPAPAPALAPSAVVRGRVLVVDDDPMLGPVIRRSIGPDQTVTVMTRAREALEALEADDGFDIVLCDLMMPEMTGVELYQRIQASRPHLIRRFVFLTGGAFAAGVRQFLDQVPNLKVEKPFSPAELRALVNRLVAEGRT